MSDILVRPIAKSLFSPEHDNNIFGSAWFCAGGPHHFCSFGRAQAAKPCFGRESESCYSFHHSLINFLSGAPVLDIKFRYRYYYNLSHFVFQISQGVPLYPPNSGKTN